MNKEPSGAHIIRDAAVDIQIHHLPGYYLHQLLTYCDPPHWREQWFGSNFNDPDFRTFALLVAEAIQ